MNSLPNVSRHHQVLPAAIVLLATLFGRRFTILTVRVMTSDSGAAIGELAIRPGALSAAVGCPQGDGVAWVLLYVLACASFVEDNQE